MHLVRSTDPVGLFGDQCCCFVALHLSNFFPLSDKHLVRYGRSGRNFYDLIASSECLIDVTKLAHDVAHHGVNALDALLKLTAVAVLEPDRVTLQDAGK